MVEHMSTTAEIMARIGKQHEREAPPQEPASLDALTAAVIAIGKFLLMDWEDREELHPLYDPTNRAHLSAMLDRLAPGKEEQSMAIKELVPNPVEVSTADLVAKLPPPLPEHVELAEEAAHVLEQHDESQEAEDSLRALVARLRDAQSKRAT